MEERCLNCKREFGTEIGIKAFGTFISYGKLERADPELDFCESCMEALEVKDAKERGEWPNEA